MTSPPAYKGIRKEAMTADVPEQDLSGYLNAAADSMNYADDRLKPLKAEEGPEVETEEVAYEQQSAVRESSGLDPETGVPVEDLDKDDGEDGGEEAPPPEESAPETHVPEEQTTASGSPTSPTPFASGR